jgi:hypothetical protein
VNYHVNWEIELYAESPMDAARKALAIQRDPQSLASVFVVTGEDGEMHHIDLADEESE